MRWWPEARLGSQWQAPFCLSRQQDAARSYQPRLLAGKRRAQSCRGNPVAVARRSSLFDPAGWSTGLPKRPRTRCCYDQPCSPPRRRARVRQDPPAQAAQWSPGSSTAMLVPRPQSRAMSSPGPRIMQNRSKRPSVLSPFHRPRGSGHVTRNPTRRCELLERQVGLSELRAAKCSAHCRLRGRRFVQRRSAARP